MGQPELKADVFLNTEFAEGAEQKEMGASGGLSWQPRLLLSQGR